MTGKVGLIEGISVGSIVEGKEGVGEGSPDGLWDVGEGVGLDSPMAGRLVGEDVSVGMDGPSVLLVATTGGTVSLSKLLLGLPDDFDFF